MTQKSFLLELRQGAQMQRNEECRQQLRDLADSLATAIHEFAAHPTAAALELVNGLWARATRVDYFQPKDDPSGGAGKMRVAA